MPDSESSMRLLLAMPSTRTSVSILSRSSCSNEETHFNGESSEA